MRLQLSMLLLPMTDRANFCAMKFISLVALEQLNIPKELGPWRSTTDRNPLAARSRASFQVRRSEHAVLPNERFGESRVDLFHGESPPRQASA